MNLRVLTVLKSGGEYRFEHVLRLRDQVAETTPEADFVCFSDFPISGVQCIPLMHDWPGWWSKIEMFNPSAEFLSRPSVIYLDLDTTVVGNLSPLASENFRMLRDFTRPRVFGSGVMTWRGAAPPEVYEKFAESPEWAMRSFRGGDRLGDQGFILHALGRERINTIDESLVVSYKKHVRPAGGRVPPGAVVVAFHGPPRPWAAPALAL